MRRQIKARHADDIEEGIKLVLAHARHDLTHIHLMPCDFEQVKLDPQRFNVTLQTDGRLVVIRDKKLIEVVAVHD